MPLYGVPPAFVGQILATAGLPTLLSTSSLVVPERLRLFGEMVSSLHVFTLPSESLPHLYEKKRVGGSPTRRLRECPSRKFSHFVISNSVA